MRSIVLTCVVLFAFVTAPTADVVIVGKSGSYSSLQEAVDLAEPGDVLLIPTGFYGSIEIDGKGLSLLGDGEPDPLIRGRVVVRNVPQDEVFMMRGINVSVRQSATHGEAFFAENCRGPLLIEDCEFIAKAYGAGGTYQFNELSGVWLREVASSVWVRCTSVGASGLSSYCPMFCAQTPGGHGFNLSGGTHALFECTAIGGFGGSVNSPDAYPGSDGGSGVRVTGLAIVVGCDLIGGPGGYGGCGGFLSLCGPGGNGGHGILVDGGGVAAQCWTLDNSYTPGMAQTSPPGGNDGRDVRVYAPGTHVDLTGSYRRLRVDSPVRVFGHGSLEVNGEPGDLVLLFSSLELESVPNLALNGLFLPAAPAKLSSLGLLPASGQKTIPFTPGSIGGAQSLAIQLQGVLIDGDGFYATSVSTLTLLDSAY